MAEDRIFLSPPEIGHLEREYVDDAFETNMLALAGAHVAAFEKGLASVCGVSSAAAVVTGTAALHLALQLAGVEAGDEVICPSLTFVATVNPVGYLGARAAFVDSDPATWTIDCDLLEEELAVRARRGSLPKALITVDLYGQCADYGRIQALCTEYGLALVEDAAEALGSSAFGRPAGSFGDLGVLSFNGNKIITTAGGGALLTHAEEDADRARFLASQAREPALHYEHRELGYNYRLSNVAAAIGRGQLASLDRRVHARRAAFDAYERALGGLPGVDFMAEAPYGTTNRWLTALTIDPALAGTNRDGVIVALEAANVEGRPVWKPMHLQPLYSDSPMVGGSTAARLFDHGLCLPSGSALTAEQLERVSSIVASTFPG